MHELVLKVGILAFTKSMFYYSVSTFTVRSVFSCLCTVFSSWGFVFTAHRVLFYSSKGSVLVHRVLLYSSQGTVLVHRVLFYSSHGIYLFLLFIKSIFLVVDSIRVLLFKGCVLYAKSYAFYIYISYVLLFKGIFFYR